MYGVAAFFFFLVGGVEALLIRSQLARPGQDLLSANTYNQVFTMHGVTMIFLVVMPMAAAFANYLLPLQIGARDVAFPRMNAFSLWCFLAGGIFLNTSWFLGGGADGGWFNYAPNSGVVFSPSHGIDFFALGLIITGIASLASAVNLTVTVLNMRAPGMTLMKHAGLHVDDPGRRRCCWCSPCRSSPWRWSCSRSTGCSTPTSSTWPPAPTRCSGSTCSGSSGTRRSTS